MSEPADDPGLPLSKKLRYGAEAAVFFTVMGLFRVMGLDAASSLGGFIGRNVYRRLPVLNRARENLHAAFPEKSDAEVEDIVVAMTDNLGRTIAEYPHL